ncbi:MAG: sodium/solute symporter [Verrucomicrobiae bacterium]|nr:sodium/solute symporter [Verrucomicrobiae bacterium]
MEASLTTLDYLVLAIYLVGTVGLGLAIGWKFQTGKDFFLAGRSLPWWAIGMSLVASDIGGTDIIGVGGAAYAHGLAVANFEWIGCIPAMIVAAFIFVPIFWRMGIYTIPEFMERRFNAGVRTALGICWLTFMACNVGLMLYASAKMLHTLTGFSEPACIWLTAALVGIYTLAGGLKAVVYTDVIQCAVMIGGCLLVLGIGLYELGGIGGLQEKLAALGDQTRNHTTLIVPADAPSPFPWPAILLGLAFILSPAYWIGNQAIMQRSLGAKSQFQAQASYVWGALLKIIIPVIIAVPGLIAVAMYPELESPDAAFPTLAAQLLPTGIRGVFLAAFVAALMSSVDSYLNASATVATNDFYRRFINRNADDHRILVIGRIATVVLMGWGLLFAFFIRNTGEDTGIYAIFQTLMSFFQGPALAIILTGFFWKRANGIGALSGFLCGITCAVGLFILHKWHATFGIEPLFQIEEPFLYFSIWAFLTALVVIVVVSLLTRPESAEKTAFLNLNHEFTSES